MLRFPIWLALIDFVLDTAVNLLIHGIVFVAIFLYWHSYVSIWCLIISLIGWTISRFFHWTNGNKPYVKIFA